MNEDLEELLSGMDVETSEPVLKSTVAEFASLGGNVLTTKPPARRFLFTQERGRDGKVSIDNAGKEIMPRGEVCILAGEGGIGKTYVVLQAAIAVACGNGALFLDRYAYDRSGPGKRKALLCLAEEEVEEVRRRIYYLCTGNGVMSRGDEYRSEMELAIGENVRVWTMPKQLVDASGQTDAVAELKTQIEREQYALVVFDPLAYFASADAETDAKEATDFVTVMRDIARLGHRPTVLVCHHTRKPAKGDANTFATQHDLRGSSGLVNAARWVATLNAYKHKDEPEADDRVWPNLKLSVVKTNYTQAEHLTLRRDGTNGIRYLEAPTGNQSAQVNGSNSKSTPQPFDEEDYG